MPPEKNPTIPPKPQDKHWAGRLVASLDNRPGRTSRGESQTVGPVDPVGGHNGSPACRSAGIVEELREFDPPSDASDTPPRPDSCVWGYYVV